MRMWKGIICQGGSGHTKVRVRKNLESEIKTHFPESGNKRASLPCSAGNAGQDIQEHWLHEGQ